MKSFTRHVAAAAVLIVTSRGAGAPLAAGTPSVSSASETLVIPGAANTIGTHASRWRSDLAIRNPGNDPIEVRVYFIRSGQPNDLATAPHKDFFLITGETKEFRNVLASELGVSGTGALVVTASRAIFPNNPPAAAVAAVMRTATPRPLAPGDAGSGIEPAEPTDAARQVVANLTHDGVGEKGLRGAVGVVNLTPRDWLKVRIDYADDDGSVLSSRELHVPPLSTAQQPVPVRLAAGVAKLSRIEGSGPYIAYATVVDNASGQATFSYADAEPGEPTAVRPVAFGALVD